jgi:hypothetical protein
VLRRPGAPCRRELSWASLVAREHSTALQRSVLQMFAPFHDLHGLHVLAGRIVALDITVHSCCHISRWALQGNARLLYEHQTGRSGLISFALTPLIVLPMMSARLRKRWTWETRKALHYLALIWGISICFHAPLMDIGWLVGSTFPRDANHSVRRRLDGRRSDDCGAPQSRRRPATSGECIRSHTVSDAVRFSMGSPRRPLCAGLRLRHLLAYLYRRAAPTRGPCVILRSDASQRAVSRLSRDCVSLLTDKITDSTFTRLDCGVVLTFEHPQTFVTDMGGYVLVRRAGGSNQRPDAHRQCEGWNPIRCISSL